MHGKFEKPLGYKHCPLLLSPHVMTVEWRPEAVEFFMLKNAWFDLVD